MSAAAPALRARQAAGRGQRALTLAAALVSVALGVTLARSPPASAVAVGGALGLLALLGLTLARRDAAVALAVLLLGVVLVEPAPSDAAFFVVIAVATVTGRFRLRDAPKPVLATLAVMGALNVMSAVQVVDPGRAALFFAITLYLGLLGLWLPTYVTSAGPARLVLRAYLTAAAVSAAIGVLALLAPVPGRALLAEGDRARALFQDPNVFGPFLVPALLMLVEEIVRPRLLGARLAPKALLAALLAVGVLFSYSRAAWLNLAVGLVVMGAVLVLRPGGARRALALVLVAATAAGVLVAIVAATGSLGFLTERARTQAYDSERFSGQRASLQPAERYPFGAGPGQFESVAGISAHSSYARSVGEQGFPGLATLLALLGYTLACAVRNAARGWSTWGIGSAALLGSWCGLLANSAFVDTLHWRHLWLLAALIWAGGRRQPSRRACRSC